MVNIPAPSANPSSVNVYIVSSTSVTVHWEPIDCIYQNGIITGYAVRYGKIGTNESDRAIIVISEHFSEGVLIFTLSSATVYTFEVAAKNSAGTGPYSQLVSFRTPDSELRVLTFSALLQHTQCFILLSLQMFI